MFLFPLQGSLLVEGPAKVQEWVGCDVGRCSAPMPDIGGAAAVSRIPLGRKNIQVAIIMHLRIMVRAERGLG